MSAKQKRPAPILQAFLLADQVYQDRKSGKWIIAGTFNSLSSTEFPAVLNRPTFAYLNLTSVRRDVTLQLKFVDMKDMKLVMESPPVQIQVQGSDPNASLELAFPVPPFPMKHPGVFSFEIHADGTLIGSLRMNIVEQEKRQ